MNRRLRTIIKRLPREHAGFWQWPSWKHCCKKWISGDLPRPARAVKQQRGRGGGRMGAGIGLGTEEEWGGETMGRGGSSDNGMGWILSPLWATSWPLSLLSWRAGAGPRRRLIAQEAFGGIRRSTCPLQSLQISPPTPGTGNNVQHFAISAVGKDRIELLMISLNNQL